MNRRQLAIALAVAPLAASLTAPVALAAAADAALVAAAANPRRSARNSVRDRYRHPVETLTFWGLKPGMTVLEIDPAGGYWTEILAPYLAATHGRYIGAVGRDPAAFKARYADTALWGQIEAVELDETASKPLAPAGSVDLVITSRNIHDWLWTPGQLDAYLAAFRAALKPGGLLGVEDHRADPRPMVPQGRDGYVNTAVVIAAVEKAGFTLDAKSEINANPKDTKDYPFGVWTLPPTRRTHEDDKPTPAGFDPAKYEAIGESDRMTLRFTKA